MTVLTLTIDQGNRLFAALVADKVIVLQPRVALKPPICPTCLAEGDGKVVMTYMGGTRDGGVMWFCPGCGRNEKRPC